MIDFAAPMLPFLVVSGFLGAAAILMVWAFEP